MDPPFNTVNRRLVGIAGTHGTGKTTLIRALSVRNPQYPTVDESLSRNVQKEMGITNMMDVTKDAALLYDFELRILDAMEKRDAALMETPGDEYIITTRTPADMVAYLALWLRRLGVEIHLSSQYLDFRARCEKLALRYRAYLILSIDEAVPFVAESGRASEESRREQEAMLFRHIATEAYKSQVAPLFIDAVPIAERVERAELFLTAFKKPRSKDGR